MTENIQPGPSEAPPVEGPTSQASEGSAEDSVPGELELRHDEGAPIEEESVSSEQEPEPEEDAPIEGEPQGTFWAQI